MYDLTVDGAIADERTVLLSFLNAQRAHVLGILDGLDEDALRRPVLPSGWNALQLVRHLTHDVERFWFQAALAGDTDVRAELLAQGDAWRLPDDATPASVLDGYRAATAAADAVAGRTSPEGRTAWIPTEVFGPEFTGPQNLREVVLHVLGETAVHAGHLDALRELIDGRQWLAF